MQREIREWTKEDIDFAYVRELPEHLKRMTAFYEFARESQELREFARAIKGKFCRIPPGVGMLEALVLGSPNFPGVPARRDPYLCVFQRQFSPLMEHLGLGNSLPHHVNWEQFFEYQRLPSTESTEHQLHPLWNQSGNALYAFNIPWTHSDAELLKFFAKSLKALRPKCPGAAPGRGRARAGARGAETMLSQLAAYRLSAAGMTFSEAKKKRLTIYSATGWRAAIRRAKEYIETMAKTPLFMRS